MKKLIVLSMSLLLLAGCSGEKQQAESKASSVPLKEVEQEAVLAGTLAGKGVTMNLSIKGKEIKGTYYYNMYGPNHTLDLQGTLEADGHLDLREVNASGMPTGHFDGYYSRSGGYNGGFINNRGSSYNFSLVVQSVNDLAGGGVGRGFLMEPSPEGASAGGSSQPVAQPGSEAGAYGGGDAGDGYDMRDARGAAREGIDEAARRADKGIDEAADRLNRAAEEHYGKAGAAAMKAYTDKARKDMKANTEQARQAMQGAIDDDD